MSYDAPTASNTRRMIINTVVTLYLFSAKVLLLLPPPRRHRAGSNAGNSQAVSMCPQKAEWLQHQ
eukprot:scaffold94114_cov23-Prasinocladus_malaysianus.AAC.1